MPVAIKEKTPSERFDTFEPSTSGERFGGGAGFCEASNNQQNKVD
jgi:hypothetical protein